MVTLWGGLFGEVPVFILNRCLIQDGPKIIFIIWKVSVGWSFIGVLLYIISAKKKSRKGSGLFLFGGGVPM